MATTSAGILATLPNRENIPTAPAWQRIGSSATPQMYLSGLSDTTQWDSRAADRMSQDALRTGPSAWRGLMNTQADTKFSGMQDQLANQQAGQLGQARSSLAMKGGLRGGSAERLASQGAQQGLLAQQGLARQKSQEGMGYDIQDELNRNTQLQTLSGMDAQKAAFSQGQNQFNASQALNQISQKRAFDMERYKQEMADLGAKRMAAAIRK